MNKKKVIKTNEEWQKELSPLEYAVTREGMTEPSFTGRYWDAKARGIYRCVCCKTPLFSSDAKFDSGCGWPSYFEPIDSDNVKERMDYSFNMIRKEIICNVCDAHLGHVFTDGPKPTGLRYCINSASLKFEETENAQDKSASAMKE